MPIINMFTQYGGNIHVRERQTLAFQPRTSSTYNNKGITVAGLHGANEKNVIYANYGMISTLSYYLTATTTNSNPTYVYRVTEGSLTITNGVVSRNVDTDTGYGKIEVYIDGDDTYSRSNVVEIWFYWFSYVSSYETQGTTQGENTSIYTDPVTGSQRGLSADQTNNTGLFFTNGTSVLIAGIYGNYSLVYGSAKYYNGQTLTTYGSTYSVIETSHL